MSFGFSVSDFIVIAEKGHYVYRRCKDAPRDYAGIERRVLELQAVLDDVESYIVQADKDGQFSLIHPRLASLHLMCQACSATLEEVNDFLKRYNEVETNKGNMRVIGRLKFFISDSEALEKKLQMDASSLQLRLISLNNLSILHVRNALDKIVREYRTGIRQPSVVSRAMIDDKPVEKEEIFEQISEDLEDKNVHPDSIVLNRPFLEEWLSKINKNGGLDEAPIDLLPGPSKKITFGGEISTSAAEHIPQAVSVLEEATESVISTKASLPPLTRNEQTVNGVRITDNYDLYADPDDLNTIPEEDPTAMDKELVSPASVESRSRSNSISSVGKPETWHPYDRPAPDYVQAKLRPLFHDDPLPDPVSQATKHKIARAFHQADYSGEEFLARRTVLQLLSVALAGSPLDTQEENLERFVLGFDFNRDGQFDKNEFTRLVQDLVRRIPIAKTAQMKAEFETVVREAKAKATTRREHDGKLFLHWGFSKKVGQSQQYIDDNLDVPVDGLPKLSKEMSFSVIAWEANTCVDKISDFEEKWIGIVPKALQSDYLDPLRDVRGVARAFTVLENQQDRHALSDLDAFLTCTQLRSQRLEKRPAKLDLADEIYPMLQVASRECTRILDSLLGFIESLEHRPNFDASVHNFGKFQTWWNEKNMKWRSDAVKSTSVDWSSVIATVTSCRAPGLLRALEASARLVIKNFADEQNKLTQYLSTPWEVAICNATLILKSRKWVPRVKERRAVFLKIFVTEPAQIIQTPPQTRADRIVWSGEQKLFISPDSTIRVAIMAVNDNYPEGFAKYTSQHDKPQILNYATRSIDSGYGYGDDHLSFIDPQFDIKLRFSARSPPDFKNTYAPLQVKDWTKPPPPVKDWRSLLSEENVTKSIAQTPTSRRVASRQVHLGAQ